VELRLLEKLFTPEEAELAVHLTLDREESKAIAERAGLGLAEAEQRLRGMARKGLIFSIEPEDGPALYHAIPWVIGIYEFQVNKLDEGFVQDLNDYNSTRSLNLRPQPIPQMRTIPVRRSIEPDLETLPYELAEKLVTSHKKFAVAPCICRRKAEIGGAGCRSKILCSSYLPACNNCRVNRVQNPRASLRRGVAQGVIEKYAIFLANM
jgi:electron transport complex protein RnfB